MYLIKIITSFKDAKSEGGDKGSIQHLPDFMFMVKGSIEQISLSI